LAVAIAIAVAISIAVANSVAITVTVAITIAHRRHRCCQPLPLRLPSTIAAVISVPLLSAITVADALAVGHCRLHHHWPLQLPSPSAITVAILSAISESCCLGAAKNCIQPIEAKNAYLILFWLDSGRGTDQSRMTDQVSSGDGQHQRWAASGKYQADSEGSGWQQGGSRGAEG
jgi:hypothetical protein